MAKLPHPIIEPNKTVILEQYIHCKCNNCGDGNYYKSDYITEQHFARYDKQLKRKMSLLNDLFFVYDEKELTNEKGEYLHYCLLCDHRIYLADEFPKTVFHQIPVEFLRSIEGHEETEPFYKR